MQPLRNRLQRAVNRLVYGERDDPYTVLARLVQRLEATLAPEAVLPPSAFPDLTDREREILGMIASGRSNAEIAGELVLSPKTVSNHVSNIFSKLQVVDRAQAVLRARQAGLG